MAKTYKQIDAVKRAGLILKHLANEKEPVSAPDIARAMEMPVGTVLCHLTTLEDLGFVRNVGDRYDLGMGLALFWARKKSRLEGERDRIDRALESINITEGGDGE